MKLKFKRNKSNYSVTQPWVSKADNETEIHTEQSDHLNEQFLSRVESLTSVGELQQNSKVTDGKNLLKLTGQLDKCQLHLTDDKQWTSVIHQHHWASLRPLSGWALSLSSSVGGHAVNVWVGHLNACPLTQRLSNLLLHSSEHIPWIPWKTSLTMPRKWQQKTGQTRQLLRI